MNYEKELAELLAKCTGLSTQEISIETPPEKNLGHFAFPCFKLAKSWKKAPPIIAQELLVKILEECPPWLGNAVATGPYINFFLDQTNFATNVLETILNQKEQYGANNQGAGKKILVEYSSPNIAKHFHIGHLGSTMIGNFLDKAYRHLGYNVTSINYLGDWGTQFGKLITAYKKWASREEIEKTEVAGLVELYVKFHAEADTDPTLNDEARAWVVRMQEGDEEGLAIWRWFVELSMREYNRLYDRLDISFDVISGESHFAQESMEEVAKMLEDKNLLRDSDGAKVVDLEEYNMPPCLILRSDGGTLYPTRDIAAAISRYNEYKFVKCLYVTGNEQSLHFAQWMKVVELLGHDWGLVHVPYGMLLFPEGKISTRRGQVIKIENLLDEAKTKTLEIIEERNPSLLNKEEIAEQVGIGALVFNKLYTSRIKDTMFDWERVLSFEGETGPYVQYTHARACSVLAKSEGFNFTSPITKLNDDESFDVLRLLYNFPTQIEEAAEKYEPYLIARHMVALAQAFNVFYHEHIILVDDKEERNARLILTEAVRIVLKSGLALLGIKAPTAM